LLDELALAPGGEGVDQVVDQGADLRLEGLHAGGGEQRREDLPVAGVVGWVDLQRDERLVLAQVGRDGHRLVGEDVGAVGDLVDVGVAGDDPVPAAALRPGHRAGAAQLVVALEDLGREGVVVDVEVDDELGRDAPFRHGVSLSRIRATTRWKAWLSTSLRPSTVAVAAWLAQARWMPRRS